MFNYNQKKKENAQKVETSDVFALYIEIFPMFDLHTKHSCYCQLKGSKTLKNTYRLGICIQCVFKNTNERDFMKTALKCA